MIEGQRKVFCVGFHKTGTSSLGIALDVLGLRVAGPFGVRDPDIASTARPQAIERLERFDAFQDNPWPLLYREMDDHCSDARFVLTLRDEDAWLASVIDHFGGVTTPMREWIYGPGHGDPIGIEAVYRHRYRRHNAAVIEHFATRPKALLVMRLDEGEGWTELCPFLDARTPSSPFPHANQGSTARRSVNRLRGRLRAALRR